MRKVTAPAPCPCRFARPQAASPLVPGSDSDHGRRRASIAPISPPLIFFRHKPPRALSPSAIRDRRAGWPASVRRHVSLIFSATSRRAPWLRPESTTSPLSADTYSGFFFSFFRHNPPRALSPSGIRDSRAGWPAGQCPPTSVADFLRHRPPPRALYPSGIRDVATVRRHLKWISIFFFLSFFRHNPPRALSPPGIRDVATVRRHLKCIFLFFFLSFFRHKPPRALPPS